MSSRGEVGRARVELRLLALLELEGVSAYDRGVLLYAIAVLEAPLAARMRHALERASPKARSSSAQ